MRSTLRAILYTVSRDIFYFNTMMESLMLKLNFMFIKIGSSGYQLHISRSAAMLLKCDFLF